MKLTFCCEGVSVECGLTGDLEKLIFMGDGTECPMTVGAA